MKPPIPTKQTIRQIRLNLQAKRFAIPKLQRNFVWDARRAAKLIDSIYYNIPIGSLFIWEMDKSSAHLINKSSRVLPPHNPSWPKVFLVIDGQQRLSVIYQAFEGGAPVNDAGRVVDFGRVCFVVRPEPGQERPARIIFRKPSDTDYVPVCDILAPDWKHRMPSQAKDFLKRIKNCRDQILNYPVPVVRVTSASLDEIGEAFIRVNSQGMRITTADRAIALMGKLDVRAMAEEVRERIRHEVFAIGGLDPILMGFNLVTEPLDLDGDPPKLEAMAKRWTKQIGKNKDEKNVFKVKWHRYQEAFFTAVEYLSKKFPVYSEDYLPSVNMLSTLSVFFYHHKGQPNAAQGAEIRKWFWATGVGNRYSGRGYHRNIVADAKLFASLAEGKRARFVFRELIDPTMDILGAEYSARSSLARAFFCLLADRQPLYLENGEAISLSGPVLSHSNRTHRHHIFPQAQLKAHFPAKVYNRLCNICFLVSRDNQKIGKKLPRRYLAEFRDSNRTLFARITRSHLIPAGPSDAVWHKGTVAAFKKFQQERLQLICSEFEKAAGIKLFTRK